MVDDAIVEVESAPADQQRARQAPAGPHVTGAARGAPQKEQSHADADISETVQHPVPIGVEFHALDSPGGLQLLTK